MNDDSKKEKILIVDDNKENIALLMNLFKDKYKIVPAIKPRRALEIAKSENPPDLILLDILMPEIDGYEVCNMLKNDEQTKKIPIIFVTAVSEVMDATKGFALGAVDYITKPFHPPMVKARVEIQLNLKRKQELLEKFAFIDALTEISNRRRLDEVFEKEFKRASRSELPLSTLMIDIDFFKNYNDTYGHGRGDEALRIIAKSIEKTLNRAGDFVARYGGEEFFVVLPYTGPEDSKMIAEKIRTNVEELGIEHSASSISEKITISIGAFTFMPGMNMNICDIIERTDSALYKAKENGRNRVEISQD